MDYPRIWLHLAKLGIDQSHSTYIGIASGLIFFLCVFLVTGPISFGEGFLYSAILCSPSIMLGIETGNTDLIMFSILSLGILHLSKNRKYRFVPYLLFLAAGFLKLFPIAAMIACFKEPKRRAIGIFAVLFSIFAIYLYQIYPDIRLMQQNAVKLTYLSYGAQVIFTMLDDISIQSGYGWLNRYLTLFSSLTLISIVVFALVLARRKTPDGLRMNFLDSFRIGASIYIISFLLWNNWDYRLMFLIFTVPQMLEWIRQRKALSMISSFSLAVIVTTLWISSKSPLGWYFPTVNHFLFDEILNLYLFGFFSYAIFLTLPEWIKRPQFLVRRSTAQEFGIARNYDFEQQPVELTSNRDTSAPV